MREILFRGKAKDNGRWVYGYIYKIWGSAFILWGMVNEVPDMIEVDPETVCQYTGLMDKNGKKIFEGDIISTPKYGIDNGNGHNFSGKDRFLVGYADGTYYLENKLRKFCLRTDSTCEVIGNIFDNPDLVEGSGK